MRKPVVERVLHGSAGFPQVGKRPFGTPWWWCPDSGALLSRLKVPGIGWGHIPLPNNQTLLPALEMRECGPSHVGFPNQDTNQDTPPPQPFQPIEKRF